ITERKNAEKELLQLSRKDEMILNSAGEGILGIDKKGNHTFVNPAAARMFGYEIQDMIGKHSHKMWHHTKADGSVYLSNECNIYASLKDGSVHYATDEVFWRKDGTSFPAEYRSTPMVENGKIVGAVVTFNDITKRKQAEEKIAESQNRLFTFLNESPLNIYFIDPLTLKIYYANPTFFKTLGYDPGEISNISLYDFVNIPKDELDAFLSVIFSSKKTSVPISRKWKRKDGTLIDMLVNISYTRQGENEFLFITAQDTSEISRLEKQLTQSNEVLSNIFNSLEKETFWSRDLTTGKMIYVSPGVEKLVGRHVVEFMQDEKKWIDVVHPDDRDTLIAALRQTENGKSFSLDFRAVLPDESVKWIHANVISIVENGKAVRVNGSLYDMTEVKLLNEQLNEKVQDMNMFIYRASHDLRGPLASILGLSALGKTESASNEQMNFYFDKINFSISRLDMIIQELSKIGRIIQVPVKIESVDLKKEIPEIIDSLRALPNSSKIKFEILIDTPKINSDKVFLIMILQNLIANAINYSDTRKSTRMITIRAFESMGGNVLVVSDNGIGIESELQKKVFDMFYRGNESSTGTGLGLYIVKQTVQKLGGRIKLSSEKGKGTSFTIILPQ
ncbi:MAG TPA: PAS domain S-box protein, partial [Bacteroidia bacterium]